MSKHEWARRWKWAELALTRDLSAAARAWWLAELKHLSTIQNSG